MEYHAEMTTFLRKCKINYRILVAEHALAAMSWTYREPRDKDDFLYRHALDATCSIEIASSMCDCFSHLPEMANNVIEKCRHWKPDLSLTVDAVEDAWFSMMFRAFCWQRSHVMITGTAPLPSEYWNSKLPVYIG